MQGRSIYGGPFVVVAHVLHVHEGRGVGGVPAAERERRDQVWDGADDGRGEEIRGRRGVPGQGAAEEGGGRGWPSTCCWPRSSRSRRKPATVLCLCGRLRLV